MKTLFAAAAFALLATTAHAADRLPESFTGKWCATAEDTYQRVRCDHPFGWLHIRPNGFSSHAMKCTLHAVAADRKGNHLATFACSIEDEGTKITNYWISRDGPRLLMNETERSN
jgi:hypothetical protein